MCVSYPNLVAGVNHTLSTIVHLLIGPIDIASSPHMDIVTPDSVSANAPSKRLRLVRI